MRESCILRGFRTRFITLREEYVAFCDGKKCPAILIAYFEFKHNGKLDELDDKIFFLAERNEIYEPQISDLYIQESLQHIVNGIMEEYQRETVSQGINLLIEKGVLTIVEESNHYANQARKYLFNVDVLNGFITEKFGRDRKIDYGRDRKIDTYKEVKNKEEVSKDTLNTPCSRLIKRIKEQNKPQLVKRIKLIYPSNDIKTLYQFWNSLGEPLSSHREDPNTKTFQLSIAYLAKYLKKYSLQQIQSAMSKYHRLWASPLTKLNVKAPGHKVSLPEFFVFTDETSKRIVANQIGRNPEDDILKDVDSWFEECVNKSWEELIVKFDKQQKCIEDVYPEVTKELAKIYREKINNNPPSPDEINIFIRAAAKLVNYHNNMKDKLKFIANPLEKQIPRLFCHHMIDAIIESAPDLSIVKVQWLVTDNQFNNRMTDHFKRLGMLEREYQGSNSDILSDDIKEQRSKEYAENREWVQKEGEKVRALNLSPEEANKRYSEITRKANENLEAITLKYKGKI
jgi:hypothetical protein